MRWKKFFYLHSLSELIFICLLISSEKFNIGSKLLNSINMEIIYIFSALYETPLNKFFHALIEGVNISPGYIAEMLNEMITRVDEKNIN